jgi:non-lysosomal glucosylceramidase
LNEWTRLQKETKAFHDALFSSTLPDFVLDAVSANISILKSPTCLRLEDGSFYGWEGCGCVAGCCEGSCTHVWNYAQALPFLFPKLERSMRDLDFRYNMRDDGGMVFRLQLPLGREKSSFRPCVDGQYGGVLKMYRDWKISGDTQWLKGHWEAIKKNIAFAWAPTNHGWLGCRQGRHSWKDASIIRWTWNCSGQTPG